MTGLSAVTAANAPDIAVGDALGSVVVNLSCAAGCTLPAGEYIPPTGHTLSAALGTLLIAFAGLSLLLDRAAASPALGHVGLHTPLIMLRFEADNEVALKRIQHEFRAVLLGATSGLTLPFNKRNRRLPELHYALST